VAVPSHESERACICVLNPVLSKPFQAVSTGNLEPLRKTITGNKYVIVFICYMTKYVELIPLKDMYVVAVADAFIKNVLCRQWICKVLQTDRGTKYLSNLMKEICRLLDIRKTQTTSFHSQCNAQSERMM
jgi:hypothetical protein